MSAGRVAMSESESHLEGKHELHEDKDGNVAVVIVSGIFLAGRDRFRSQIVPGGWYLTTTTNIVQVLSCFLFHSVSISEEGQYDHAHEHPWVKCIEYCRRRDPFAPHPYPMLIEIRKLTCPAALLVRPEHVLGISKNGAFLDTSKVSVDISGQVQTKGHLLT